LLLVVAQQEVHPVTHFLLQMVVVAVLVVQALVKFHLAHLSLLPQERLEHH
jgi:hypothetical protein